MEPVREDSSPQTSTIAKGKVLFPKAKDLETDPDIEVPDDLPVTPDAPDEGSAVITPDPDPPPGDVCEIYAMYYYEDMTYNLGEWTMTSEMRGSGNAKLQSSGAQILVQREFHKRRVRYCTLSGVELLTDQVVERAILQQYIDWSQYFIDKYGGKSLIESDRTFFTKDGIDQDVYSPNIDKVRPDLLDKLKLFKWEVFDWDTLKEFLSDASYYEHMYLEQRYFSKPIHVGGDFFADSSDGGNGTLPEVEDTGDATEPKSFTLTLSPGVTVGYNSWDSTGSHLFTLKVNGVTYTEGDTLSGMELLALGYNGYDINATYTLRNVYLENGNQGSNEPVFDPSVNKLLNPMATRWYSTHANVVLEFLV